MVSVRPARIVPGFWLLACDFPPEVYEVWTN